MSKEKIFAIATLLTSGFLILMFGAPSSPDIFTRQISYINQSGQTIGDIRFQAGREVFNFSDIPVGKSSTIYLGRWSAYEVTISVSMEDGSTFGPTQFMLPSNTISRSCIVRIRPNGVILLDTN